MTTGTAMTNDDLARKIATVEGHLQGLVGSLSRIEQSLEKVVSMDRTLAEQIVKAENQQQKVRELEHDIKGCQQTHKLAHESTERKLSDLTREFNTFTSRTEGVLLTLKLFSGFAVTVILGVSTWAYTRVDTNTQVNVEQTHRISTLERDIGSIHEILRKVEKKLDERRP